MIDFRRIGKAEGWQVALLIGAGIALACLPVAVPASAQAPVLPDAVVERDTARDHDADPEEAASQVPIIVEGDRADPPTEVKAGSRIPTRKKPKEYSFMASTDLRGFTPGSGMTPFSDRTIKWTEKKCVSGRDDIGKRASCLLLAAQNARAEKDVAAATDIYRFLVSSDQFSPAERMAGGTELHNLASSLGDGILREEALLRLLDAGVLSATQQAGAGRTLANLALERGDKALAIKRLELHVARTDPDPQSLANLAILLRSEGLPGAGETMNRAIAANLAMGVEAPQGWLDFAAAEPASADRR